MTLIVRDELRKKKIREALEAKEAEKEAARNAVVRQTMRITIEQYVDLLNRFDPQLMVVLALGPEPDTENDDDVANLEMHVSLDMVKAEIKDEQQ